MKDKMYRILAGYVIAGFGIYGVVHVVRTTPWWVSVLALVLASAWVGAWFWQHWPVVSIVIDELTSPTKARKILRHRQTYPDCQCGSFLIPGPDGQALGCRYH